MDSAKSFSLLLVSCAVKATTFYVLFRTIIFRPGNLLVVGIVIMSLDVKCCSVEACPYLNVVEFCPYEGAADLLAYGSTDSLCLCSINFQTDSKSATQVLSNGLVLSHENLITFDYKGISLF